MSATLSPPLCDWGGADSAAVEAVAACLHCGTPCGERTPNRGERTFCCAGCRAVYELLHDHGLDAYYRLSERPGVRREEPGEPSRYAFLEEPAVRDRLLDYADERTQRVTLQVPAIHCLACVWLLENLFRFRPGIGRSTVNFTRREVAVSFDPRRLSLAELAGLLDSLGYAPDFTLADLDRRPGPAVPQRLWLQLGVAGFVFGNTMLFSLAGYFGLDAFSGPAFRQLFGWLSLLLAIPVVAFSAADYWRAAWLSLRQRQFSIEVPIALGIAALAGQSVFEVLSGRGEGYFDSLAGLLFFLLAGRVFQSKVFDRLSFDRDYRAFFPLSVARLRGVLGWAGETQQMEERVSLAQLQVGDRLRIRNGELIPADARLVSGDALVDYGFVTGEAEPVRRAVGDLLYAGGRQTGGALEVEILKPVSQSYLTTLWNQEVFRKERDNTFDTLTNRYSVRFTWIILGLAVGAALFWAVWEPARSLRALVGVLIVACPCALALAAPFTLGTAVRVLGRRGIFLRNPQVVETLARTDVVVFDKTGTLTVPDRGETCFSGADLSEAEAAAIRALARQSTHPLAGRVAAALPAAGEGAPVVEGFREIPGAGVAGHVRGVEWRLGSRGWLEQEGVTVPDTTDSGATVHLARGREYRGRFTVLNPLRPGADQLIGDLSQDCDLALLSGDHARERERFRKLFGKAASIEFNQSPTGKLEFIRRRQERGGVVMMVGDGLNDAGALRQSDVGVAVVEQAGMFSPASDVILEAGRVDGLGEVRRFARASVGVVRASFVLSTLYNVVGLSIAAAGRLSPVVCAILMPLSSITVVAFAVGTVQLLGRRMRLSPVAGTTETKEQP